LVYSVLTEWKQKVEILHKESGQFSSNWGIIKCGVRQGSALGPLLFLLYITDLPFGINTDSKPPVCADDTSVLFTSNKLNDLQIKYVTLLNSMSKWFTVNGWLNLDETKVMKFDLYYLHNEEF
jgi:hypothetical protein